VKTNSSVTVYNKYIDASTRSEKYQRTQIAGVEWENRKAANVIQSGLLESDSAAVYIPFKRGSNYLNPSLWLALIGKTGKWTLKSGDVIVKGLVTDEISSNFTISDLKAKYSDVLVITSVDTMDQGSAALHHWQIGAK
jgi:hypothetical protein